jgi:hypothetical protein
MFAHSCTRSSFSVQQSSFFFIVPYTTLKIVLKIYITLENLSLNGDVAIAGEGLQNLGLCSALRAFELGGVFIAPHHRGFFSGLLKIKQKI